MENVLKTRSLPQETLREPHTLSKISQNQNFQMNIDYLKFELVFKAISVLEICVAPLNTRYRGLD